MTYPIRISNRPLDKERNNVMNIIIVGCGKVGMTLAEQLDQEGHSIVAIDNRASQIDSITSIILTIHIKHKFLQ